MRARKSLVHIWWLNAYSIGFRSRNPYFPLLYSLHNDTIHFTLITIKILYPLHFELLKNAYNFAIFTAFALKFGLGVQYKYILKMADSEFLFPSSQIEKNCFYLDRGWHLTWAGQHFCEFYNVFAILPIWSDRRNRKIIPTVEKHKIMNQIIDCGPKIAILLTFQRSRSISAAHKISYIRCPFP